MFTTNINRQRFATIELPKQFLADSVIEFKRRVDATLNDQPIKAIVLDFQSSQLVDSSALGAIVSVYKQLGARNIQLVLCGMNQTVMALFELTQLQKIFHIEADIQTAYSVLT